MCGIIGFIGFFENTFDFLFKGLVQLQNRGYDSAGICTILSNSSSFNEFKITKFASSDDETALQKIDKFKNDHFPSNIGIGHTRWATHGEKNDINSHPHCDSFNKFSLIHNGIIENYSQLKKFLLKNGFIFKSQTDTEVIVNLISYFYLQENDTEKSIIKAVSKLQGTYALCILSLEDINTLYCIRSGSPLLVGINDNYCIVTSESSGFCGNINNYFSLENHDLCIIRKNIVDNKIELKTNKNYSLNKVENISNCFSPDPYPHWTLKEIMEQPESISRSISFGGRLLNNKLVKLGGLESHKSELKELENIIFLGCGTSLYSAQVGATIFKELCNFNTVSVLDGAEFSIKDVPKKGKTGLIFLSQSGETRDLFNPLEISKEHDLISIGVINVVDSYLARNVNCGVYLNAGREVAVASTKSFSSQIVVLSLIGVWFSQLHSVHETKRLEIIRDLRNLSFDITSTIEINKDISKQVALDLKDWNSLFILGKGSKEYYGREGSLKLKEIGYIHSEAYNSSSLKHGPYSLITENQPIFIIINKDEYFDKNQNIIEEIKSRKGKIIAISEIEPEKYDILLKISDNKTFRGLLSVIVFQLISYELALLKGHNPDMPRNLAKVVTVD